jgi:hypothetical protein
LSCGLTNIVFVTCLYFLKKNAISPGSQEVAGEETILPEFSFSQNAFLENSPRLK